MESNELEAEGEALRRTLERIEFLLKQGFISEEDAACRKQGAIDNFCLAPMIDRRQRLQTEANRATFGAGRDNAGLPSGGNTSSSPAAASAGDAVISAVDSEHPTSSLSSSSSSTSEATGDVLGGSGHVLSGRASPSSTVSSSNPGAKQSRKRRLTEAGEVESEQLLVVETSGVLLGFTATTDSTPTPECEAPGLHLLPTCGSAGGNGNAQICAQHRSTEMLNSIRVFAPVESKDPQGSQDQRGSDGANPLKVPDAPIQSQPQSQPQPQQQPKRHPQHPQPPPITRESCTTDLPAPRDATSVIAINRNSRASINCTSDLPMEQPTEPRVLTIVPEAIVDMCTTVASDGEAITLPTPPPGVLTATNPTPTPSLGVGGVSVNTYEDLSSTDTPGDSTDCGSGLPARSMPLPVPGQFKRGTCEWRGCTKEPHYAVKGQRARTCFGHKEEDWVHVSRRRCDKDGCPRGAYFSLQGSTAIFCSAHRTPAMVDVINLRRYKCHTEDCQRQAYYNFLGLSRSKAKFCSTHKLPDMLNVRHRLCQADGCRTTPTYSMAGDRPRFCASHKTEAMVDTKSKTCAYVDAKGDNCLKCRLYGLADGKATYCFKHKSDGMINIRQARKRKKSA